MNNEPVAWMSSQTDEDGDTLTMLSTYHDPLNTNQVPLYTHPVKELTEILATIKCIADDISGYKDYENTYSDGWLDACNTVYDEVFTILRKAQE